MAEEESGNVARPDDDAAVAEEESGNAARPGDETGETSRGVDCDAIDP